MASKSFDESDSARNLDGEARLLLAIAEVATQEAETHPSREIRANAQWWWLDNTDTDWGSAQYLFEHVLVETTLDAARDALTRKWRADGVLLPEADRKLYGRPEYRGARQRLAPPAQTATVLRPVWMGRRFMRMNAPPPLDETPPEVRSRCPGVQASGSKRTTCGMPMLLPHQKICALCAKETTRLYTRPMPQVTTQVTDAEKDAAAVQLMRTPTPNEVPMPEPTSTPPAPATTRDDAIAQAIHVLQRRAEGLAQHRQKLVEELRIVDADVAKTTTAIETLRELTAGT